MQPEKTNSGHQNQLERSTNEKLSEKHDSFMKQVNKENDINPIKMYEDIQNFDQRSMQQMTVKPTKLVDTVA